jgi:hypothetical protein
MTEGDGAGVGRFGLQALPHEVKVETVATWGGAYEFALALLIIPQYVFATHFLDGFLFL